MPLWRSLRWMVIPIISSLSHLSICFILSSRQLTKLLASHRLWSQWISDRPRYKILLPGSQQQWGQWDLTLPWVHIYVESDSLEVNTNGVLVEVYIHPGTYHISQLHLFGVTKMKWNEVTWLWLSPSHWKAVSRLVTPYDDERWWWWIIFGLNIKTGNQTVL